MLLHYLKCRENTESKNQRVAKTKKVKSMLLSKCAVCDSKKLGFIKSQETSWLLSSEWIRIGLDKTHIIVSILFWGYKMHEVINKFLLVVDKIVPEVHSKQPGFTYSVCRLFTKNKENIFIKIN